MSLLTGFLFETAGKNIEYFVQMNRRIIRKPAYFFASGEGDYHDSGNEVTEEEAIFNNELNEIDEHENFAEEPKKKRLFQQPAE
jgi:hypothetical protein